MRKIYALSMFAFLLVLTGCSVGGSDYEQFKSEVESIQNLDQLTYKVNLTSGEMELNMEASLDETNNTEYINVFGMEIYVDQDFGYLKLLGTWIKSAMSEEDLAQLNEDLDLSVIDVTLPEGSTPVYEALNDQSLKDEYDEQTLDEVIVSTGDNSYSFKGEEEYINMTIKDNQLTVEASDPEDSSTSIKIVIGEGEEVVVPDEAKNAKEADNAFKEAIENLDL